MKYWWILFIIILCAVIAIVAIYVKPPSPQPQSGAIFDLLCKKKITTATNNANRTCRWTNAPDDIVTFVKFL